MKPERTIKVRTVSRSLRSTIWTDETGEFCDINCPSLVGDCNGIKRACVYFQTNLVMKNGEQLRRTPSCKSREVSND